MRWGVCGALFWALETLLLSTALGRLTGLDFLLASLLGAACHDLLSAGYLFLLLAASGRRREIVPAICSSGGRKTASAALLGGPGGMTCYLAAIGLAGAGPAASVSALYPAIGAALAVFLLHELIKPRQALGMALSIGGVMLLGGGVGETGWLRLLPALLCAACWGSEAVLSSIGMKEGEVDPTLALLIRQTVSAAVYWMLLLPVTGTLQAVPLILKTGGFLPLAALAGGLSYLFYYRAIRRLGPSRAMALNITYTVWVLCFEAILARAAPTPLSILCALCVSGGSALAAWERPHAKELNDHESRPCPPEAVPVPPDGRSEELHFPQ